jgi:hypothetical protein
MTSVKNVTLESVLITPMESHPIFYVCTFRKNWTRSAEPKDLNIHYRLTDELLDWLQLHKLALVQHA